MAALMSEGSQSSGIQLSLLDKLISIGFIAATLCWSYFAGKDLNFDQLSYHFYLPFHLLGDRLEQDFLGANGQSYLNPLPYLPFYLMVKAGWHSVLVAGVLAAIHSSCVVLAYRIGRVLMPGREGLPYAALGALLAFLSPIFLVEAGTTFADVSTAVLVLAALLIIVRQGDIANAWKPLAVAGLLFGAATAMKLSNAIFAIPLAFATALVATNLRAAIRPVFVLGLASIAGFVLVHGYWGWRLWQEFGNPVFPLFNALFPSPDYPVMGGAQQRFLPRDVLDYFTLPFRMVSLRAWIHLESVAPDLRFAAFALGLLAVLGWYAIGILRKCYELRFDARQTALLAFTLVGYCLWLATSGNGRYGIVISLLCGPCLALLARAHLPWRAGVFTLALLAGAQTFHAHDSGMRWTEGDWTDTWYEVSVPEKLRTNPYLYVSVGGNANSYLYPFLHEQSAFTNPIGQISIDLDDRGGARLRKLFEKHAGRVRVIALLPDGKDSESIPAWTSNVGSLVSRLGFAIDSGDCEHITAAGTSYELGQDFDDVDMYVRRFRTCRLQPQPFARAAERARIERVVDEIRAWCPKLFQPAYGVVEVQPDGWFVAYPSTDTVLAFRGEQILITQQRSMIDIPLGTLSTWKQGQRRSCDEVPVRFRDVYGVQ